MIRNYKRNSGEDIKNAMSAPPPVEIKVDTTEEKIKKYGGMNSGTAIKGAMTTPKPLEVKPINNISQRLENGEDLYTALLNNSYEENEADIKRQRAADFWANVAKVFGQAMASKAGVRQFDKVENRTPYYNDQLLKLKQAHNNAKAQHTLLERKYEIDAKREQEKRYFEFNKDVQLANIKNQLEANLIDKRTANSMMEQLQKAKDNKELEALKHKFRLEQQKNKGIIDTNIANIRSQEKPNDFETIVVNRNGKKEVIKFNKAQRGAVASLYNRLREEVKNKEGGKDIGELKLEAGENTDQTSKALATLGQYMQYYPELTEELEDLLEGDISQWKRKPTTNYKPRLK